jgi:hypothetical protein
VPGPLTLQGDQLRERFLALDAFLAAHVDLWRPKPFTQLTLAWEAQHAQLATWLRARTLAEAEAVHNSLLELDAPAPFPALARQAHALSAIGPLPTTCLPVARHRLNVDVPGRKWQQIEAFAAALPFAASTTHWLDWCAGKGHLGRRLLRDGQHLTCLEHDPALVTSGAQLSTHHALPAHHQLQDVMADDLRLEPSCTPVALHACGDLHVQLMHRAAQAGCQHLAFAPCCYNRTHGAYRQLCAQPSALSLPLEDLGLPLEATVTAGARVRRQRDTSMARRLAFDLLQREQRGIDHYLPCPSLPAAWLDKPFAEYCRDLAALQGVSIGRAVNFDSLEAHGWQRLAHVRNLELLRGLFRRPLELWLVLDRALYLQERQYAVQVGTFCPETLTPRNLMIIAERF